MRLLAIVLSGFLLLSNGLADDVKLTVTPDKCVALHKGQTCYQTINIEFVASATSDYCLRISEQGAPLQCWRNTSAAEYRYNLAASSAVEFEVIDARKSQVATARVNVAWIYKKSRTRSRWRLF